MTAAGKFRELDGVVRSLRLAGRGRQETRGPRPLELVPVRPFSWRRETHKLDLALGQLGRSVAEPNNILAR